MSGSSDLRRPRGSDLLAVALVAAVTVAYVVGFAWHRAELGIGEANHDMYADFYPDVLYAQASRAAGEGMLWNRFQNCGQPFLAVGLNGVLYPPYLIFRLVEPHTGLFVLLAIHLLMAGLFAYLLFRELGCGPSAALSGALAFELGGLTLFLAYWSPANLGHYVFLPAAVWACERILHNASIENAVLLGVVLSVQFLAGNPQTSLHTYQLIALRVAWELGRRRTLPLRTLAMLALGMLLPAGLIAVQLFPSLELTSLSVRGRALTPQEIRPAHVATDWNSFRNVLGWRMQLGSIFSVGLMALLGLGLTERRTRGMALFYLLVAGLSFAVAFDNPISQLYTRLPLGATFRFPERLLWVGGFAFAALAALGSEAVVRPKTQRGHGLFLVVALGLGGVVLMQELTPNGLSKAEIALAAAVLVVAAGAVVSRSGRRIALLALPLLVGCSLTALGALQPYGYLRDESRFFARRPVFDLVRQRMTLQDRMYQFSIGDDPGIQRKSASVFRLPSITDYETQAPRSYAELFIRMIHDKPMSTLNQFYYQLTAMPKSRALLNLLAARHLIVSSKKPVFLPPQLLDMERTRIGDVVLFENRQALPRAFFVARVEVVSDRAAMLERLASPSHDPRRVALVEEVPPGGGLGSEDAAGSATFVEDRSETLALRVSATQPGFLFLADQFYPGWEAIVNGVPAPITRANYTFRLVRMPEGESEVVFRYRPLSLRVGRWVSAFSAILVTGLVVARLRRKLLLR